MNKQKWISRALEMGIEELEIYQGQNAERKVVWYEGQMDSFVTSSVLGTSIRGILNGKAANLALESVDDRQMDETLGMLIEQARLVSSQDTEVLREAEKTDEVQSRFVWVRPSMEDIREKLSAIERPSWRRIRASGR